jgi:type IV secretion system protein VirD4
MSAPAPARGATGIEGAVVAVALALVAAAVVLWLATSLSAALFGRGWPALGAADTAHALVALPHQLSHPARAWPLASRAELAGPVGFYATLATLLAVSGTLATLAGPALARAIRGTNAGGRAPAARWALPRDLRRLFVREAISGRVTLGRCGRRSIAAEERTSVMVVAPAQSGKTTSIAVPALLEWRGPAIATSVKTDLLNATVARRRALGRVAIFDPTQATGQTGAAWSPLGSCGSWHGAQRMASWLCAAARPAGGSLADADFWYGAAAKLLAPLLLAAATSGREMGAVVRWVDTQEELEVRDALTDYGELAALRVAEANLRREERQRSSIYTTAETVLAAYSDPRVLEASRAPDIAAAELLDGGANTLYLCAPAHEQRRLASLFAALIEEMVSFVYESAHTSGKPIDPPLLFVGDELANIAPLRSLAELASTGGGQGLQLVSVFQDLAQVRERWGDAWRTVVNNHRAKLFGAGIGDPETLEYVSRVSGEAEFRRSSETMGYQGDRSSTEATTHRDLAPANVIREAEPGTAVLIYGNLPPARLRLRPFYRDRALRLLAQGGDGGAKPPPRVGATR